MLEAFRELSWKRSLGTGTYEEAYFGICVGDRAQRTCQLGAGGGQTMNTRCCLGFWHKQLKWSLCPWARKGGKSGGKSELLF